MTTMRSILWQDLTNAEIADLRDAEAIVAIPVGAIEQHGPHLCVETDALLSRGVTLRAAQRSKVPVVVAPALPYGFSPHHVSHPGTISLRLQTYMAVIEDIARSLTASGFRRIVFVNGHGGNSAPLRAKVTELVTDGMPAAALDYWTPSESVWIPMLEGALKRGGHACEMETAVVMALKADDRAEVARLLDGAKGLPARTIQPWVAPGHPSDPLTQAGAAWPPIFQADDCGYYGDPGAASEELGVRILEVLADALARFFEGFAATPLRLGVARDAAAPSISAPLAGTRA
jgi:creatinine amidohydrolase